MINESTEASSQGVFSKGAEVLENHIETGPNYKTAAVFFIASGLFFLAAFTALPFFVVSPGSFNLYFCFGSIFLQLALSFFYGPLAYLQKLFSGQNRIISGIYICALLVDLYFIWTGAGYLMTLLLVAI